MNRPQTMNHLTTDVLPIALYHLRAVGCNTISPFTLALAAWEGERVDCLKTSIERQQFQGLHLAACVLLDVEPHAPDLRSLDQRECNEIRALADAYHWAAMAHHSHADALVAYAARRKQQDGRGNH